MKTEKPEVLCFSEHWLKVDDIEYVKIEGYKLVTAYFRRNYAHGGTVIFAKTDLTIKPIDVNQNLLDDKNFELSSAELTATHGCYLIMCVYRSPVGNFDVFINNISSFLQAYRSVKKQIIVCGDFNVNFNSKCKNAALLVDTLRSFGLILRITDPTRVTKTSQTCIDNIFTSGRFGIADTIDAGLSDHCVQVLNICIPSHRPKSTYVPKRMFSNKQINEFGVVLSQTSWESIFDLHDVNEMFDKFMEIFSSVFNEIFPLKKSRVTKTTKTKAEWFSPELKIMSLQVTELYIKSKAINSIVDDKAKYRTLLRKYKSLIRDSKQATNKKLIQRSGNKSKQAWNIVKNNVKYEQKNDDIILRNTNDDELSNNPRVVANMFNDFFKDAVANALPQNNMSEKPMPFSQKTVPQRSAHSFFLSPVNAKDVLDAVDQITKKRKAAGFDGIPGHILKHNAIFIIEPLIYIINSSFSLGVFPDKLKLALICPLHKKGCRTIVSNYRPIAILSIFSKIFEKCFCIKLTSFLEKYNIITESQHGFRSGKSTTSAMLSFINQIYNTLGSRKSAIGVFYDFTKAFDMVNHSLLINKLKQLGINGIANDWIKSYLTNRRQITKITNSDRIHLSNEVYINIGVPQGSIIAPLLFILYTNDLPSCIEHGELTLFADDTTHLLVNDPSNDTVEVHNNKLATEDIAKWVRTNELSINYSKTVVLQFHYNRKIQIETSPLIHFEGKSIVSHNNTKFLGIVIDNRLEWDDHIHSICKKVASGCFLIKRILQIVGHDTAKVVYYSYIHSRLLYGIQLWGHSRHTKRLFILQKRAIRHLAGASRNPCTTGMFYKDSCRPYFIKYKILTLPCAYIYSVICLTLDTMNTTISKDKSHINKNNIKTRNGHLIKVGKDITKYDKMNPKVIGIKVLNKAIEICNIKPGTGNITACKSKIKYILVENAFYSIDEFLNFKL